MKRRHHLCFNIDLLFLVFSLLASGQSALHTVRQIPASTSYYINLYRHRHDATARICLSKLAVFSSRRDFVDDDENQIEEEDGKFLRLGTEISKSFGPLGLIIAGYNEEEYLDLIIDAFERTLPLGRTVAVAILGKSDLKKTFQQVLSELQERDCILPADGDQISLLREQQLHKGSSNKNRRHYLRYPLVLCSGFEAPQLQVSYLIYLSYHNAIFCS